MPARLLAMTMCLSVMNQCSVETDGRIELVLRVAASFDLYYRLRCLTRKFVYQQSVCASLWNSVPNSAILPRDVDRRNVLSILDEKLKLDRRRSIKLTVPPSSDARPL